MAGVMIRPGPHKASHTAVAISGAEEPLGELRVRACAVQAERLLAWAAAWPERTWAVEGAGGLGHLLAQQLLSPGERVLDVQPKLGARVRLLATEARHSVACRWTSSGQKRSASFRRSLLSSFVLATSAFGPERSVQAPACGQRRRSGIARPARRQIEAGGRAGLAAGGDVR